MLDIVLKYNSYLDVLKNLISKSHYKSTYFIEKLNLNDQTFYRKLRENKFTSDEILELTKLLFPEEFYKYEFMKDLAISEDDIKNGRLTNSKDYLKELESL